MSFEWSFRYFVVFPVIRVFLVNEGTGFYMMATIPLCDVAVCTRFRIKKMNCRSSSIGGSHIEQIALPPLAGVGYETQGPSPSFRAESRARIFEFPIFAKLRSGLCFYISLRIK